jgi:hypothetical protein
MRFFAVGYLGRIDGQQIIGFFSRHYRLLLYILIALAVMAGIGTLVYLKGTGRPLGAENAVRGKVSRSKASGADQAPSSKFNCRGPREGARSTATR